MPRWSIATILFQLLLLVVAPSVLAQDESCRSQPTPECQCGCRVIRSAVSVAPRGVCRIIESGPDSCQLRWSDASRRGNQIIGSSDLIVRQRVFLDRAREGELGTKARGLSALRIDALAEIVRRSDLRLPNDALPLEIVSAYLSIDPDRQQPEPLLASYLVMLGPAVEAVLGTKAAAELVDYLTSESKAILERTRSKSNPEPRPYKSDTLELIDESARGCLELLISSPKKLLLMVKAPYSTGRNRCRD